MRAWLPSKRLALVMNVVPIKPKASPRKRPDPLEYVEPGDIPTPAGLAGDPMPATPGRWFQEAP